MLHIDELETIININESILDMNFVSQTKCHDKNVNINIVENIESIKKNFETVCHQINSAIRYYHCVNMFLKHACKDIQNKLKRHYKSSKTTDSTDIVQGVGQEFEDDEFDKQEYTNTQLIENQMEANSRNTVQQSLLKYWIKVQKNVLFNYAFLISPQKGLIIEYSDFNCKSYQFSKEGLKIIPTRYDLTITSLKYIKSLFTSIEKSLYNRIFTDELVLIFTMMHWFSFFNLYRKLSIDENLDIYCRGDESQNISTIMKYYQKLSKMDINNAALELCKHNLK